MVIWITGLSGAGKTTLAAAAAAELRRRGVATAWLDGDAVRQAIADPGVGHDRESRLANARRISRLAALLERQGLTVVVSTMSLFREIHRFNRGAFERYFEVLVEVDLETLRRRDPRGLYRAAEQGAERNVAGLDLAAELPESPHLRLDNRVPRKSLGALAARLVRAAIAHGEDAGAAANHSERAISSSPASTRRAPPQRAKLTDSPRKSRAESKRRTK